MATRYGRCVNFGGNCANADARVDIPVPPGVPDTTCPICGKTVRAIAPPRKAPVSLVAGIIVFAALALVIGRLLLHGNHAGPATTSIATAAPSASPATQPASAALKLCGSPTIGRRLAPDLSAGLLRMLGTSVAIHAAESGDSTVTGIVDGSPLVIAIAENDDAGAFRGLQSGQCRIGMSSRRIFADEATQLGRLGNMFSASAEHVIGLDAVSVIVNPANPVSDLTVGQVQGIFTGGIDGWGDLGAGNRRIKVVATDNKDGPLDTFDALVLNGKPLVRDYQHESDEQAVSSAVRANRDAVGFTRLANVGNAKTVGIASAGTAIQPTRGSIGREDYPLTRRLYLYTGPATKDALASKLIAFTQSDAGQRIVNDDGFIGTVSSLVAAKGGGRSLPAGAPPAYANLVRNFVQADFNLYFNTGSYTLDNKALVDVGRLVELLSSDRLRGRSVVLAGFTDNVGERASNLQLSRQRADAAAVALRREQVRVSDAIGFGEDLPIRDNATAEGREKNRRVEIFFTR